MKISVVIPHKNRYSLLDAAIMSLLWQEYNDWECIVVDDGSNRLLWEEIAGKYENEERIRFVYDGVAKGANVCRNKGLELVKTSHVIFMDSDDIMSPWCISTRMSVLQKYADKDYLVFKTLLFEKHLLDMKLLWNDFSKGDDILRMLRADSIAHTSAILWNTESLRKLGGWDVSLICWQDWELTLRALMSEMDYAKCDVLPDVFIRRGGQDSISANETKHDHILQRLSLFDRISDEINDLGPSYSRELKGLLIAEYHKILEDSTSTGMRLREVMLRQKWLGQRVIFCLRLNTLFNATVNRVLHLFGVRRSYRTKCMTIVLRKQKNFAKIQITDVQIAEIEEKLQQYNTGFVYDAGR
jgi:glycosyltransferase involved in cell wall biosynthesis